MAQGSSMMAGDMGRGRRQPRGADAAGRTAANAAPRQKSWLRAHLSTLIAVAVLLVGLGFISYPTIANYFNELHQSRVVMDYAQAVSEIDQARYDQMLSDAAAYNARLAQTGDLWTMTDEQKAEYESLLNVDGTGVMGYITIPKINVQLPVYHGTDDAVLQTSIGHLAGTSLPVGGDSTHSVLSGHRGLPSARLFSDLDQIKEGDRFTLTILNETLTYEVDQIRIVEPDDLSDVQIEQGKDLCTLVTCTPYGINTQRLLVRGHRVPNGDGDARVIAEAVVIRPSQVAPILAAIMALILVIYVLASTAVRGRKRDIKDDYLKAHGLHEPVPDLHGSAYDLEDRGEGRDG